ncbi:MAG: PilZ domain-containing protein [Thermoanaerobaculum sp.]
MAERRSAPRLSPTQELSARVRAFLPARVVDISRTGVQLELSSLLRIGVECDVKLTVEGVKLRWPATVRRCRATRFGVDEHGQKVLLYRAGLEFAAMSDEDWARLQRFLAHAEPPGTGVELDHRDVLETPESPAAPDSQAPRTGPIKVKVDTSRFRF